MASASRRGREKMGMKEECVCSTGGSGTNRTVGYVTAVFGFLMNLSHPAHWLLSCYCWQKKCCINTLTSTSFTMQKCLKHTQHVEFNDKTPGVRALFALEAVFNSRF